MKTFVRIVLGNLVALILFGFVAVVFMAVAFTALLKMEEPVEIRRGSVLVFNMSANLTDSPPGTDFWQALEESIGPKKTRAYSLRAVTDSVRRAATELNQRESATQH
jgi:protease IV